MISRKSGTGAQYPGWRWPDNLVLLLQVSRGEIHSLVDIRMSSYGTSSYKVWTVVGLKRSIDEAIALRRCEAKGGCCSRISSSLDGPRTRSRTTRTRSSSRRMWLLVLHKIGDICGFRGRWTNA